MKRPTSTLDFSKLWLGMAVILPCLAHAAPEITAFSALKALAKIVAGEPYEKNKVSLPDELASLNYDAYRDIRFKPEQAVWRNAGLPIELQMFHLGLFYEQPVSINLIGKDGVQPVPVNISQFDYGKNERPQSLADDFGFAGFRMHYPLNTPDYKDEVLVFQGASYFRAVAAGQQFGLSARGLAIDTAERGGEEFPTFTDFWVEWPRRDANTFKVLALLDSESITGAYSFEVKPGEITTTTVKATLYVRQSVSKLGIAPLTSMFQYAETDPRPPTDFRPEVHDSDGLLMRHGSEWVWRPLANPKKLTVNTFSSDGLRGFGLMQRDRDFGSYADLEAGYHKRPSAWVQTRRAWKNGHVELVQIPTQTEYNDNIVAYWVPDKKPQVGDEIKFNYTIQWRNGPPDAHLLAKVSGTRIARGEGDDEINTYVIDFEGGRLHEFGNETVEPDLGFAAGFVVEQLTATPNPETSGYRVVLKGKPDKDEDADVDLRLALRDQDDTLVSEVWTWTETRQ